MNKVVKDYFKNYGLPNAVLQNINDQIESSAGEDPADDVLETECAKYALLAKSFQSEVDSRVTAAVKRRAEGGDQDDKKVIVPEETGGESNQFAKLEAMITGLTNSITELKSEKVSSSLGEIATNQLKGIKMTDSEIRGLLFGRKFKTDDEVTEFVEAQSEIHAETLKDRQKEVLGNGTEPTRSMGKADAAQLTGDIEAFKNSIKQN